MSQNKNALIRYKTIDKCLQNKYRKWSLGDLITACSDALYEYEGRSINVSKRTIQLDIQTMRSDKLGYNAPIIVSEKKYYCYEDENFSITNIPITENDMNVLSESVEMLKQFKDFSLFSELGGIIQRLEDKIHTEKTKQSAVIYFDKNEDLKGLEYLDIIYQAIQKRICLHITYQSFKARNAAILPFCPYILKEFNNRWFLIGRLKGSQEIKTFALDRISNIDYDLKSEYNNFDFDGQEYYKNTIGVTVMKDDQLIEVIFKVDKHNTPYVITKPFHASQQIIQQLDNGAVLFKIKVHHNFELERLLLGFGSSLEVISPSLLRRRIRKIARNTLKQYDRKVTFYPDVI